MQTRRYVALLRGINVGGNKKVQMAELRALLERLGYANVKTLLNSGNAAWDADGDDIQAMRTAIEADIQATFGFSVSVIVLPRQQVENLVKREPFADVGEITDDMRLYVTFLPAPVPTSLSIPWHADTGDFTILSVSNSEVCSVLTLGNSRSVDAMTMLEKEFGKTVTTRNWNTVVKLAVL
jgi:uncharacterized protein (DUF1697 family)